MTHHDGRPLDHLLPVSAQRFSGLEHGRGSAVHDFMVLAFVTRGSAVFRQRQALEVREGDVYLVPAGERHGLVKANAPEAWGIRFCPACFAPTELGALLDPFERAASGASAVVHIPGDRQEHLARLCAELHEETIGGRSGAHAGLVQKSLLALVLAEVGRASAVTSSAGEPPSLVADALRFIEKRCLGAISLGDVAAAVHRSPSHVSTAVRRATGKTVVGWITAGRLSEARNRLLHSDERVDIIAERVGYSDPTHFIRLFRKAHGATPAAWRARQRALGSPAEPGR